MEIIGLIIVVVIIYFFATRARSRNSNAKTSTGRQHFERTGWSPSQTKAGLVVTLSSDVTLTFSGGAEATREVENYLRSSSNLHYPERALRLALLMSRLNVECLEVEEWRKKLVASIQRRARAKIDAKATMAELHKSDPDLYKEILEDAEQEAFENLEENPCFWRTLDELLIPRPKNLSDDDMFLAYINNSIEVLSAFNLTWVKPGTAVRLTDHGFVEWTKLVNAGLALRGADTPTDALVNLYKLAELNAVLQLPKPFRKKADAKVAITSDLILKLPDISKVFYLKPMPKNIEAAEEAFGWGLTHAKLVLDTVRTFEAVQMAIADSRGDEAQFQIYGECCKKSVAASGRNPTTRLPPKLPPFHISCDARLERY